MSYMTGIQESRLLATAPLVPVVLTAAALVCGCEQLGLERGAGSSTEVSDDAAATADPQLPLLTEPAMDLPPLVETADPGAMSPQQFATYFSGLQPNRITDTDLQQAAATPLIAESVTSLDLRGAALTAAGVEAISRFKSLRELDMTGSVLSQSDWQLLGKSVQLESLSLESAGVGDSSLGFLEQLVNLRSLNLQNCNLTDLSFVHLKNLSKLEELQLSGIQQFTGAGLEALGPKGARARLRVLGATGTRIGVFGFAYIDSITSLEVFAAGSAAVTDDNLAALKGNKNLRMLHLGGNQISDRGLRVLTSLKVLDELDISGSQLVSNATLQRIKNHKQLKALNIEGTSCNQGGVAALKGFLPECRIRFGGMDQ
jgi:Leucine Rich repeats (2 copies)/Leucine Rich repeat